MPDVRDSHAAAHGPLAIQGVREAVQRILEVRHAQRARPTFGDEADQALLAALRGLSPQDLALAAPALEQAGDEIGRHVVARRCYEDSVQGAVAILSATTLASGWGGVAIESWFHRQGVLVHSPPPALAAEVSSAFVSGLLAGYLGEVFNCRAAATPAGAGRFEARLLEGRDVNARRRSG